MKKILRCFVLLLFVLSIAFTGRLMAEVIYDTQIPQVAFAAQELENAVRQIAEIMELKMQAR